MWLELLGTDTASEKKFCVPFIWVGGHCDVDECIGRSKRKKV